ncbi:BQ2448_3888 [Microbotryum intermedium]|uniref:BQ2448_3888 protein n=1 Tax=Microbotryum intermedium TaxID=269621 RepID=A0A238FJM0_9BASI|nr:BQ2448_3888 [Microbotryum intermedium]
MTGDAVMPPLAAAPPPADSAGAPHSADGSVAPRQSTPTSSAPMTDNATSRWEAHIRSKWLAPPPHSSSSSSSSLPSISGCRSTRTGRQGRPLDPVFRERLRQLERMLRLDGATAEDGGLDQQDLQKEYSTSHKPSATATAAAVHETESGNRSVEVGETPDGGDVIGVATGRRNDLKKTNEGILLAFKQGRVLREPLPLSLVTALLYRSWEMDGTIPADYLPIVSANPMPYASPAEKARQVHSKHMGPETEAGVRRSSSCTRNGLEGLPDSRIGPGVQGDAERDGERSGGLSPKMRMDRLKGARWRTEKEVASGSDVI